MLVTMAVFVYYPLVQGFSYAFQKVNLLDPPVAVGLENFRRVLADPAFWPAWQNVGLYTVLILFFANLLPLVISLAIHELRWGRSFFQLAACLPMMMPPVVTALLFDWIFDPGAGLLNSLLSTFGIGPQPFLQSPSQSLPSVAAIAIWGSWGLAALVYLAALQQIPPELYEATEIDGAGIVRRIRHVTLPQVRGQILILLLLGIISASQIFTQPYVLTGGGPADSTVSVVQLVYRYAFEYGDLGGASALSLMFLVVLACISAGYMAVTNRMARI
ncbi:carbohydrate ABC transporter permease [Jiangella muralis]|uniref:carbohydrate ABC transporter permease n=1 Tax=Jiangella muralis TaxID=702383 RepID=UPI00069FB717|nr:sugar ABC transporter permease [Jiangella muralis]